MYRQIDRKTSMYSFFMNDKFTSSKFKFPRPSKDSTFCERVWNESLD